ncbi:hypothetical protein HDV02_004228 [Globomyces sp. JEL0801]|nr:hypothetical protein HDV02_004228 [Globomyces sp. JEL0801]
MSVSTNIYKQLGIANGSLGRIEAVLGNSNGRVLALKVFVPPISQSQSLGLPGLEPNKSILERLTATETYKLSNGKAFTLRRMQFPITEALSITDYKPQGQTYQSAILNLSDVKGVSTYIKLRITKNAASTYILDGYHLNDLEITYPMGYNE